MTPSTRWGSAGEPDSTAENSCERAKVGCGSFQTLADNERRAARRWRFTLLRTCDANSEPFGTGAARHLEMRRRLASELENSLAGRHS
jgi:hypothetical protein